MFRQPYFHPQLNGERSTPWRTSQLPCHPGLRSLRGGRSWAWAPLCVDVNACVIAGALEELSDFGAHGGHFLLQPWRRAFSGGGQLPVGSWKWWSSSPKETYGISWTIWCFFNISVHAFPCGLVVHTISNLLIQTLHAHACPTILYSISMGYTHFSSPLACPPASTSSTLQRSRNLFGHCTARPLRRWAAPERGDWDDSRSLEMGRYIICIYIYIYICIYICVCIYMYIYVST